MLRTKKGKRSHISQFSSAHHVGAWSLVLFSWFWAWFWAWFWSWFCFLGLDLFCFWGLGLDLGRAFCLDVCLGLVFVDVGLGLGLGFCFEFDLALALVLVFVSALVIIFTRLQTVRTKPRHLISTDSR